MQTFIKSMHSVPSRLVRVFGGLWLVIYAACGECDAPQGSTFRGACPLTS
jgi:hypothetical protein